MHACHTHIHTMAMFHATGVDCISCDAELTDYGFLLFLIVQASGDGGMRRRVEHVPAAWLGCLEQRHPVGCTESRVEQHMAPRLDKVTGLLVVEQSLAEAELMLVCHVATRQGMAWLLQWPMLHCWVMMQFSVV